MSRAIVALRCFAPLTYLYLANTKQLSGIRIKPEHASVLVLTFIYHTGSFIFKNQVSHH